MSQKTMLCLERQIPISCCASGGEFVYLKAICCCDFTVISYYIFILTIQWRDLRHIPLWSCALTIYIKVSKSKFIILICIWMTSCLMLDHSTNLCKFYPTPLRWEILGAIFVLGIQIHKDRSGGALGLPQIL